MRYIFNYYLLSSLYWLFVHCLASRTYCKHKNFRWGLIFVEKQHPRKLNLLKFVHTLVTVITVGYTHPWNLALRKSNLRNIATTKICAFTEAVSSEIVCAALRECGLIMTKLAWVCGWCIVSYPGAKQERLVHTVCACAN